MDNDERKNRLLDETESTISLLFIIMIDRIKYIREVSIMSKYGSGYQVEGIRRKYGMEKNEKTLDIRCPFSKNYHCTKEPYPISKKGGLSYNKRNCISHQCTYFCTYKENEIKKFRSEQRKKERN